MGLDVIAREQAFDTAAIYVIAIFLVLWNFNSKNGSWGDWDMTAYSLQL